MTYSEDRVLAAAREAVASLGEMVRQIEPMNPTRLFRFGTFEETHHFHHRPEPVRKRVKREYRPKAGRSV